VGRPRWLFADYTCFNPSTGCHSTVQNLSHPCVFSCSLSRSLSIAVIAPKFEEFSDQYTDAVFLKVIGDASPDASKLMKREGVRTVPSFHYFVNGQKVDVINGANAEAIEAAITKHTR
jgi:thioredoxin-like negative regulator of GroEL